MVTYEQFYFNLPATEQALVSELRDLVLSCSSDFREKMSYNVPYYFRHSRVCFIWPASVKYGPKVGVWLGLCRGAWLSNEQNLIHMDNRKEVGVIPINKISDIDTAAFRQILQEAIILDDEMLSKKK